jgi:hypothetical protein
MGVANKATTTPKLLLFHIKSKIPLGPGQQQSFFFNILKIVSAY